jgi:pectinesterase
MSVKRLFIFLLIFSLFSTTGCLHQRQPSVDFVVSQNLPSKKNTFNTIQAAIDAVPENSEKTFRILIRTGQYYEKLTLTKSNVQLIGADKNSTRIYYDAYAIF